MGSGRNKSWFSLNIFMSAICFFKSSDGQVTLNIFLENLFQKFFLNKFSFGKPEILNINFVLKLKKLNKKIGKAVTKCPIRKSGLVFDKNLNNGIIERMNINKYENLLLI